MDFHILAMGRLKKGPESTLIDDYVTRLGGTSGGGKSGRPAIGTLGPLYVKEAEAKKGLSGDALKAAEADLLRGMRPEGAVTICLDERGKTLSSREFADKLVQFQDNGARHAVFMIGGADGLDKSLRAEADLVLSFGRMTLPHMLARVILAEQLYRAATIAVGHPYHRD